MKRIYILLLLIISDYCGRGQLKHTTSYSAEASGLSLCSGSIILDSLGFFYEEAGCEGRGYIAFGKYELLKERKLLLTYLGFDKIKPLIEVTRSAQKNSQDSIISIGFYAKDEVPLNQYYLSVDVIDSSGKFFKTYYPDKFGLIQIKSLTNKTLRIHSTDWFMGETKLIKISKESMKIKFNVPISFFYYKSPRRVKFDNILMVIEADGLYDTKRRKRWFVKES